jgi:hypothetical protein
VLSVKSVSYESAYAVVHVQMTEKGTVWCAGFGPSVLAAERAYYARTAGTEISFTEADASKNATIPCVKGCTFNPLSVFTNLTVFSFVGICEPYV